MIAKMKWLKLLEEEQEVTEVYKRYTVYCKKCGHSMVIGDDKRTAGKKICTHCGTLNYSKKRNFKEEMMKRLGSDK